MQTVNKFLEANYDEENWIGSFFIIPQSTKYSELPKDAQRSIKSLNNPFAKYTMSELKEWMLGIRGGSSKVEWPYFAILDNQSMKDDTVCVCATTTKFINSEDKDVDIPNYRGTFKNAGLHLYSLTYFEIDWDEAKDIHGVKDKEAKE
jgi:hypothetical protein